MSYSQRDGFNNSLSRLGHYNYTLPTVSYKLSVVVWFVVVYKRPQLLGVVVVGGTIMWYLGRR